MTGTLFPADPVPAPAPPVAVFRSSGPVKCGAVAAAPKVAEFPALSLLVVLCSALIAALSGCGTGAFRHDVEIALADPSGRLGVAPHEVSVFDWRMGQSAEWARRTIGPTSPTAPYRCEYGTVDTVVAGARRPERVELALFVPALEARGFFVVKLEPKRRPEGEVSASFAPWGEYFPAAQAPRLAIRYAALPGPKGWRLALVVSVPAPPSPAPPSPGDAAAPLQ